MKLVVLGDLIKPARVRRAGNRDYPILSMTMQGGLVDQSAKFKKRVASADVSAYKVVANGQLVVGFPIDEGVLDFQQLYPKGIVSPAYGVWDLTSHLEVDRGYLKRFLRSPQAMAYYKSKLRGSTARRRSLPREVFLAMPVPLPPIDRQRHIATTLDQADTLRAKRRLVTAHLDSLIQSIFHDMFGGSDVATTELGRVCTFYSGGTPSKQKYEYWMGDLPWFSAKDLKEADLLDSVDHISQKVLAETNLRLLPAGTVVLVVRGMILARTIPVSVLRVPATINQDLKALIPRENLDAEFLAAAIRARSDWILARTATAAHGTKKLDSSVLGAIPIPMASSGRQAEFAARVAAIRAQRTATRRALAAEEELFASLQFRAFRGEL